MDDADSTSATCEKLSMFVFILILAVDSETDSALFPWSSWSSSGGALSTISTAIDSFVSEDDCGAKARATVAHLENDGFLDATVSSLKHCDRHALVSYGNIRTGVSSTKLYAALSFCNVRAARRPRWEALGRLRSPGGSPRVLLVLPLPAERATDTHTTLSKQSRLNQYEQEPQASSHVTSLGHFPPRTDEGTHITAYCELLW